MVVSDRKPARSGAAAPDCAKMMALRTSLPLTRYLLSHAKARSAVKLLGAQLQHGRKVVLLSAIENDRCFYPMNLFP